MVSLINKENNHDTLIPRKNFWDPERPLEKGVKNKRNPQVSMPEKPLFINV